MDRRMGKEMLAYLHIGILYDSKIKLITSLKYQHGQMLGKVQCLFKKQTWYDCTVNDTIIKDPA